MPPPGASAPAFAATAEASADARCGQERVVERVLRNALHPASILDFRPELGNRCKLFPVYTLFRASILDFRPELENHCRLFPRNSPTDAVILDFKPRLENRCMLFPVYTLFRASILDFKPRLENRCSAIAATVRNGFACSSRSGNEVRVLFYSSLPQRRIARLQHRCEAQAGTGCHEGGIILSKKPPEWHLSLPQQRSASDSNFRCCS